MQTNKLYNEVTQFCIIRQTSNYNWVDNFFVKGIFTVQTVVGMFPSRSSL